MKGKYAAKAATRKAELEATANIEGAREQIERLTSESERLRARLVEKDRAHSAETKRLKGQIRAGASPALEVAAVEAAKLRSEIAALRGENRRIQGRWDRLSSVLMNHFTKEHGMSGEVAAEALRVAATAKHGTIRPARFK